MTAKPTAGMVSALLPYRGKEYSVIISKRLTITRLNKAAVSVGLFKIMMVGKGKRQI